MWLYFYPHLLFHMTRWFPKNNRVKFRILSFFVSICLIIPEFYVLLQPKSARGCDQPLLAILVASAIFLFFSVGFAFLFTILEPIERIITLAFHLFGFFSFILGVVTVAYTFQADACAESMTELYYWCYVSSILTLICIGYFALLTPFWIAESVRRNSVLNEKAHEGVCYAPVVCCPCLWHVV